MDFQKKFILKRDDASMDKDDNQVGCLWMTFITSAYTVTLHIAKHLLDPKTFQPRQHF